MGALQLPLPRSTQLFPLFLTGACQCLKLCVSSHWTTQRWWSPICHGRCNCRVQIPGSAAVLIYTHLCIMLWRADGCVNDGIYGIRCAYLCIAALEGWRLGGDKHWNLWSVCDALGCLWTRRVAVGSVGMNGRIYNGYAKVARAAAQLDLILWAVTSWFTGQSKRAHETVIFPFRVYAA